MILTYFRQIFKYFEEDRAVFLKYSIFSFIAGVLELIGVALIYPLVIKILSDKSDYGTFAISPIVLGLFIIILFLLKNIFMIYYTYIQAKFTHNFEAKIKKQFIKYFLAYDYKSVSKLSLAEKGKIFNFIIPNLTNNFIMRLLNLNVNVFIAGLLVLCVAIKFPLATAVSALSAIILVFVQNKLYKPLLNRISEILSKNALSYEKVYNEIMLNLKELKYSNNEIYFYKKYEQNLDDYTSNRIKISFFNLVPPYVIEPFVIILLFILLGVICVQNYQSTDKLIASFALIVSAIFRLAPSVARIQVNLNGINSNMHIVKEFIDIYESNSIYRVNNIGIKNFADFKEAITLNDVSFSYNGKDLVLKGIDLTIKKGEFVGIVGVSGAGKTTLTDIIAGLYAPTSGQVLIDNNEENLPLNIGYIPQEFSLISGNIRENVAFGSAEIDDGNVIEALKKAQLYDYIIENYEQGIYANPFIDSTGISLGQRQRIAIARALYKNPDILILDEATSSLDAKTENEICKVLNDLKGYKTIIAVTHRLSTIKNADKIVLLKNNAISKISSYAQIERELAENGINEK